MSCNIEVNIAKLFLEGLGSRRAAQWAAKQRQFNRKLRGGAVRSNCTAMRFVGLLLVSLRRDARARSGSPVPAIGVGPALRPREARATFGARGDDAAAQPAAPAHADRRLDAVCDNSLGEAFATSPGATFQEYAYAACYASYGAQCVEGQCGSSGAFQYYYYEPDGDCACHKAPGTYEFVFSNSATSDISIGVDYLDEDNNLIEYGNQLFVRKKNAGGCGNNAWSLHYDFPDDNLCQATHAPTSMPTASSSSPSPVPSSSRPSPAPSTAPSMSAAPSSAPCTAQNSLGEAFGTSPGATFRDYAYAACYASYGAYCVEGSCGSSSAFQYYYYQPDGHCSWSKAPGTYEVVFSNSASSAISVGDPYSHDDRLIEPGNQLFVRVRNSSKVNRENDWSLHFDFPDDNLCHAPRPASWPSRSTAI